MSSFMLDEPKRIKINKKAFLADLPTDDEIGELSATEMIYVVRAARIALDKDTYLVHKMNDNGQVYIDEHSLWISSQQYEFYTI